MQDTKRGRYNRDGAYYAHMHEYARMTKKMKLLQVLQEFYKCFSRITIVTESESNLEVRERNINCVKFLTDRMIYVFLIVHD